MMAYFLLFLAGLSSATATLLLRRAGMTSAESMLFGLPFAWSLAGLALVAYGFGFLAYAQALKTAPVNLAYPVMTGVTLLLTLGFSALWLGESIGPRVALGALLLLVGIVLIGAR